MLAGKADYISLSDAWCYQGTANHPPDCISRTPKIAFEIKKTNSTSIIHLNSSFPEQSLKATDNVRITKKCKEIIGDKKIPFMYVIGRVIDNKIKDLWILDGLLYAASSFIYNSFKSKIKNNINTSLESLKTNEIANFKNLDPLKITSLRVRGMWIIDHPCRVFKYLEDFKIELKKVKVLMSLKTYELFNKNSRLKIEKSVELTLTKFNKFKNPDNPSDLIKGIVITF